MSLEPIDVIPRYAFWQDGCRTLVVNTCAALRLAGEPVTPGYVLAFIDSLPRHSGDLTEEWRKSFCSRCLEKAYVNTGNQHRMTPLEEYFLVYFVERDSTAQAMLIEACRGILGGIAAGSAV